METVESKPENESVQIPVNKKKSFGRSIKRQRSLNEYFKSNKKKSPTIISPYDIEGDKYLINLQEIDNLPFKEYYINFITQINKNKLFNLKNTNIPTIYSFIMFTLIAVIFISSVYFTFLLFLISCFNPMIFVILLFGLRQLYNTLFVLKYLFSSKIKRNMMKSVISSENETCTKIHEIYWELGKECLWIELHQIQLEQVESNKKSKEGNFTRLIEE